MTMYRMVDGVQVEISPEEEALILVEWDANAVKAANDAWKESRIMAYGSFGEQLDMMYHDELDGTTTWKDHVAAVKAQFPKPEGV